jgi:hypothetical protein
LQLKSWENAMTLRRTCVAIAALAVAGTAASQSAWADKWEELGCQKVGFLIDRDVVKVGRHDGRFKAIRLEVSGNTVYIEDLKVVYGNGVADDIPVRSEIRDGGQTRALDLKGRDRAIDRVEMVYRAQPNFKGSAKVCVYGLD